MSFRSLKLKLLPLRLFPLPQAKKTAQQELEQQLVSMKEAAAQVAAAEADKQVAELTSQLEAVRKEFSVYRNNAQSEVRPGLLQAGGALVRS